MTAAGNGPSGRVRYTNIPIHTWILGSNPIRNSGYDPIAGHDPIPGYGPNQGSVHEVVS